MSRVRATVRAWRREKPGGGEVTSHAIELARLWTAIQDLWVDGARTFELSLDQAAVNGALGAAVHAFRLDLAFASSGIVVSATGRLGPLRLPSRRYTLRVGARLGRVEVDVTEVLAIPLVAVKIAAMLDTGIGGPDGLTVRRRGGRLTVGHPQFRCERVTSDDGTLRIRIHVRRGSSSTRSTSSTQDLKRRRKSSANRS